MLIVNNGCKYYGYKIYRSRNEMITCDLNFEPRILGYEVYILVTILFSSRTTVVGS